MTDVILLPPRKVIPFHSKRRRPAAPTMERRMSATATPDPDRELLNLCARAAELERQIAAAWELVMAKGDGEDADTGDLEDEIGTLNQAIVKLRPATLRGFVAKAKRAHKARAGDERPPDEAMDEMLVTALVTDLVAMEA